MSTTITIIGIGGDGGTMNPITIITIIITTTVIGGGTIIITTIITITVIGTIGRWSYMLSVVSFDDAQNFTTSFWGALFLWRRDASADTFHRRRYLSPKPT